MRLPRLKPDYQDSWHHCYNRTAGTREDRPFDDADKEAFVRILHQVSMLYTVRVAAYQVMSNHFHLILHTPEALPPRRRPAAGSRRSTPGNAHWSCTASAAGSGRSGCAM